MSLDLGSFSYVDGVAGEAKAKRSPLSWRNDPEQSLSDWTIVVVTKQPALAAKESRAKHKKKRMSKFVDEYSVHKAILGAGRRSGQYFERLFRSSLAESNNATSNIELEDSAAEAFPAMLDFMYSTDDAEITTENAVALRYLASYFGIEELFDQVNTYIQGHLCYQAAPTFLSESAIYQDEKILRAAATICAQNFAALEEDRVSRLSPELFQLVVSAPDFECTSEAYSRKLAAFCENQENVLDADLLKMITSSKLCPTIDPEAAIYLLKLAIESGLTSGATSDESLKNRCMRAACSSWEISLVQGQQFEPFPIRPCKRKRSKVYDGLPSDIRCVLLESALASAKATLDELRLELQQSRFRCGKGYSKSRMK